jgi:hypothetical protein
MRLELRRQFEMKIAMAFPIEGGGVFKAARPVCAGDFSRRACSNEGFLFNPATHPANAALQKWNQWHNDRELFIFGLSAALATGMNLQYMRFRLNNLLWLGLCIKLLVCAARGMAADNWRHLRFHCGSGPVLLRFRA